jgi:hypothetical protein
MHGAASPRKRRGFFADRALRVARRTERDTFRHVIMPAAWVCGALGVAVLVVAGAMNLSTGGAAHEATGVGLGLAALPVVLFFYRILRGHFCEALNEP